MLGLHTSVDQPKPTEIHTMTFMNDRGRSPMASTSTAALNDQRSDYSPSDKTKKRRRAIIQLYVYLVCFCTLATFMTVSQRFRLTLDGGDRSNLRLQSKSWSRIQPMPTFGQYPRISYVSVDPDGDNFSLLNDAFNHTLRPLYETTVPEMADQEFFERLELDERYHDQFRGVHFETDDCKAQHDWQLTSFPTCNGVHEHDIRMMLMDFSEKKDKFKHVGRGGWRDVWILPSSKFHSPQVLKTLRKRHEYFPRYFDLQRRDAIISERLTESPFVLDIYGFCGMSGVYEFAGGGDIGQNVKQPKGEPLTMMDRLHIGVQAAMGLAALHNFDEEGRASVAHGDIKPAQFVRAGGFFKLNDFNEAHLIRKNVTDPSDQNCPLFPPVHTRRRQSPEEYKLKPRTEKIDLYALGNVMYYLLTASWPFHGMNETEEREAIERGDPIPFEEGAYNATDPIHLTLHTAMKMCHIYDPTKRATAREVEAYLKGRLEELDPGRIQKWLSVLENEKL